MRIFNILIMSKRRFHDEKRESEKTGFDVALAHYNKSDAIVRGSEQLIKGKTIKKDLVLLGDNHLICGNTFLSGKKVVVR